MAHLVSVIQRDVTCILTATILCVAVGCGSSAKPETPDTQPSQSTSQQARPQDKVAMAEQAQQLSGTWFGVAMIDREKLQAKLNSLSPAEREVAAAKAASFLTTEMGIEYRNDGQLVNEMQMQSIEGKVLSDQSTGFWEITEVRSNGVVVQTNEQFADGTRATQQVFHEFLPGGGFMISIPVAQEIEGCDSILVFERRSLQPVNVAEENQNTDANPVQRK